MNSIYRTTNLLLFTLERCDNFNSDKPNSNPYWRVRSHNLFFVHPPWGPFQRSRVHAVLSFLGYTWDEIFR